MRYVSAVFVASGALLLVSCGGGGGDGSTAESTVAVTELQLSEQQRASLQGDWQLNGKQTAAFVVRTSDEWNQLWAQRKAYVTCSATAAPYNQAFCESSAPPPVDFTRYALVGLLINSVFYFDTPTPRSVNLQDDGNTLAVSYRYINPSTPTFFYTVTGRFFLVERTAATFQTYPTQCSISC